MNIPRETLKCLLEELRDHIEGGIVKKVQELKNGIIRIRIFKKQQADLCISDYAFFISKYKFKAKENASGFSAYLNKNLKGSKIEKIELEKNERIINMNFSNGKSLIIELFGKGNIILVDQNKRILSAKRFAKFRGRAIERNKKYEMPKNMETLPGNEKDFEKQMKDSKNIVKDVVRRFGIASIIVELAYKKSKNISEFYDNLLKLLNEKCSKAYLYKHREKLFLIPFKLELNELANFESVNDAINEIVAKELEEHELMEDEKEVERIKKSIERLKKELEERKSEAERYRKIAEKIYENYSDAEKAFLAAKEMAQRKEREIMYKDFGKVSIVELDLKRKKVKFLLRDS